MGTKKHRGMLFILDKVIGFVLCASIRMVGEYPGVLVILFVAMLWVTFTFSVIPLLVKILLTRALFLYAEKRHLLSKG